MIDPRALLKSFKYAFRGIMTVFRTEQSFRLQILAALFVLLLATGLEVRATELIILLLLIVAVLVLELINSIFERIVDTFKPRVHPMVGEIKDIMAGTVLIASLVSAAIGCIIFVPRIFALVSGAN